jgi:hypothetical protein
MASVDLHRKTARLKDLPLLLRELPELGAEAAVFKKDLRCVVQKQPWSPQGSPWE